MVENFLDWELNKAFDKARPTAACGCDRLIG